MIIGILKEASPERRVSMLPEGVAQLIKLKAEVIVETTAGETAFASDESYRAVGASICSHAELLDKAQVLLCIHAPQKNIIDPMKMGQVLIGGLNPVINKQTIEQLAQKGVSSFSLDFIPRTTRAQAMDILSSMATVAGYKAVLDAALNLPRFFPMFMSAAGTIKPATVLILGAGVAGLQAVASARKLGAVVEVFDVRTAVKEEVKSLGGKFIEVEGARDEKGAGGYAVEQTEEFKAKQRQLIHEHAKNADVVICTAQIPGKKAPVLLTRETVESMRPGSVVVDLAASTGGNCELTQNDQVIVHQQVKIIGNSGYPSLMPSDASKMFGNNIINFMKLIINKEGELNLDFSDELVKGTCITHQGKIDNERYQSLIS